MLWLLLFHLLSTIMPEPCSYTREGVRASSREGGRTSTSVHREMSLNKNDCLGPKPRAGNDWCQHIHLSWALVCIHAVWCCLAPGCFKATTPWTETLPYIYINIRLSSKGSYDLNNMASLKGRIINENVLFDGCAIKEHRYASNAIQMFFLMGLELREKAADHICIYIYIY